MGGSGRAEGDESQGTPAAGDALTRIWPLRACLYTAAGALAVGAYFTFDSPLARAAVYDGLVASGAVAVVAGGRAHRPKAVRAWFLLAISLALLALGDVTWDVYELGLARPVPLPSFADAFYLPSYLFLVGGVVLLVRHRSGRDLDASLDGTMAALAVLILVVEPVMGARGVGTGAAGAAVAAAYVLADVAVLGAFAQLLSQRAASPALGLLSAGLLFLLIGDLAFAWLGAAYETSSWVDVTWMGHAVWIGAAALHPSMVTLSEPVSDPPPGLTRRRLAVVCAALLALPVDVLVNGELDGVAGVLRLGARVGLIVVVAARLLRLAANNERSEARLTSILANSGDAIVYGGAGGRIEELNPAAEAMFGWARQEMAGRSAGSPEGVAGELVGPDVVDQLRTRAVVDVVVPVVRADGSRLLASARVTAVPDGPGPATGWVAVARDSTASLLAQSVVEAIDRRDPQAFLGHLGQSIRDFIPFDSMGLYEIDGPGSYRRVVAIGPPAGEGPAGGPLGADVLGWLAGPASLRVVGEPESSPLSAIARSLGAGSCLVIPVIDAEQALQALVVLGFHGSGPPPAPVVELAQTIRPAIDRSVRTMMAFRRQGEAAHRLQEIDRLKADFLCMVAHDLRAPVAAIKAGAEALFDPDARLGAQRRQRLSATLLDGARDLERLVADVIESARTETGAFPCQLRLLEDPAQLIRSAAATLACESDRVDCHVPRIPAVLADHDRLRQVLINLMSNGLKFSPVDRRVEVRAWAEDSHIRVAVADRGIGIAADQM
ncbi:MAG: PAS domain S-box protein, partial [Acidimicrobiales bacterium]